MCNPDTDFIKRGREKLLSVTKIMLGVSGRKVLYQSWTVTKNKLFPVTVYTD
jgi:hypothetical protein